MKVKLRTVKELAAMYIDVGEWIPALRLMLAVVCKKLAASKDQRKELKKEIIDTTLKYLEKFSQHFSQNDGFESALESVFNITLEVLMETKNFDLLFTVLPEKIPARLYWKRIS